jgi:hypothetical protein
MAVRSVSLGFGLRPQDQTLETGSDQVMSHRAFRSLLRLGFRSAARPNFQVDTWFSLCQRAWQTSAAQHKRNCLRWARQLVEGDEALQNGFRLLVVERVDCWAHG